MNTPAPYYLGCPVWACRDWIGSVFPSTTDSADLLREYAKRFNAVEGNSFFYALPPMATIEKWMAESGQGFRFCPKFSKAITHERRLTGAEEETAAFLKALETLQHGERLGPSFLQLPPSFNANSLDTLERYLKGLPSEFAYAVEARHVSWFDKGDNERRLDDLLENLGMDKVIFDSRPLFASEARDDDERSAQSRKPQTPVRQAAIGKRPFLRLVGSNDLDANDAWIKEWAPIVNKWILEERQPYLFAHCPNEAFAPYFAQRFHQQLRKLNPLLEELTPFASESETTEGDAEQLDLF